MPDRLLPLPAIALVNTKGSVLAVTLFYGTINAGMFTFLLDWRYYVIELLAVIFIKKIFCPHH